MPIYEYSCRSCGHLFEKLVSASNGAITCERCDSSDVEKMISIVGGIFSHGHNKECPVETCCRERGLNCGKGDCSRYSQLD
ncbi:hypothetical protein GF407_19170 [candidate division KSB1 bacterium]|nr:hypothetical protein [candidate division KSB1 bacterium]